MNTRTFRLLDLFCGEGGAAMGYARSGFEVLGVDITPQPNYPFDFICADAIEVTDELIAGGDFDAVHASPPCQRFSSLAKRNANAHDWPDLIAATRDRLAESGLAWVIENVQGAPLRDPVMLCGTMFDGLRVIRHRFFESNIALVAPPHTAKHPLVFTHDKRKAHYGRLDQDISFVQVTGGGNATIANKRAAMGCEWMSGKGVNEAIPPPYAAYIGGALIEHLEKSRIK